MSSAEQVPPSEPWTPNVDVEALVREALHLTNNRLSVMTGLCDLGAEGADDAGATRESFRLLRETTLELGRMVRGIQRVLNPARPPAQPLDLTALLRALAEGTEALPIDTASLPLSPPVRIDAEGLEFALRELVANARAFAGADARIRLRLQLPEGGAGSHVRLSVEDDGPGLDTAFQARAGQPFATTQVTHPGRGLGLAAIEALMDRAGGRLELTSRPGAGVVATLVIPVDSQLPGGPAQGTA